MVPNLKVKMLKTDELVPYAGNAKKHGSRQIEQIAESIDQLGFNDPVGIWHDGNGNPVIVEGHGRVMAAKLLGIEEVPVITLDHLDDEGRRSYGLIHNQLTMNSGFDLDALNEELLSISTIDMSQFDFDAIDVSETNVDELPDYRDMSDSASDTLGVFVKCDNESEQQETYESLLDGGYECRLLTL